MDVVVAPLYGFFFVCDFVLNGVSLVTPDAVKYLLLHFPSKLVIHTPIVTYLPVFVF